MATMKLRVAGLDDEDAARRVESALRGEAGVFSVVASPRHGCIEVDFEDDEITAEHIMSCLRAVGFEAQLAG